LRLIAVSCVEDLTQSRKDAKKKDRRAIRKAGSQETRKRDKEKGRERVVTLPLSFSRFFSCLPPFLLS
jgi:hypothetical protein